MSLATVAIFLVAILVGLVPRLWIRRRYGRTYHRKTSAPRWVPVALVACSVIGFAFAEIGRYNDSGHGFASGWWPVVIATPFIAIALIIHHRYYVSDRSRRGDPTTL